MEDAQIYWQDRQRQWLQTGSGRKTFPAPLSLDAAESGAMLRFLASSPVLEERPFLFRDAMGAFKDLSEPEAGAMDPDRIALLNDLIGL